MGAVLTVFFDIDQTLWDFRTLMRRALARTIDELLQLVPQTEGDLSVESFVADRQRVAGELRGTGTSLEEVRLHAFQRSLKRLGADSPGLAEHLNTYYFETRFDDVELFPDVLPTLETLSGRYRLGLLSNGNAIPDRLGLERHVEAAVFAAEVGFEKPDRRIFATAERTLPGDGYVMVGDSLLDDVAGAQAAGWAAVWLNREQALPDPGVRPEWTATTLAEIPAWLDSLR
jgi:putative hydrolase of the HAD superfamily